MSNGYNNKNRCERPLGLDRYHDGDDFDRHDDFRGNRNNVRDVYRFDSDRFAKKRKDLHRKNQRRNKQRSRFEGY